MQHTTHAPARAIQRIAALGVATLAAVGLTLAAATPALAHDELIDTGLEFNNSTGELSAINLMFSNDIMKVGTEIVITDEANTNVSSVEPEISGPNVRQALDAPLAAGAYQAIWRVVSSDGHPIQGASYFEVAEDGTAELTAVGEDDPRFADGEGSESEQHDHGTEGEGDHSANAEGTANSAEQSGGLPIAATIWIALGVLLIAGVGVGAFVVNRRKQAAGAAQASDEANENEPTN